MSTRDKLYNDTDLGTPDQISIKRANAGNPTSIWENLSITDDNKSQFYGQVLKQIEDRIPEIVNVVSRDLSVTKRCAPIITNSSVCDPSRRFSILDEKDEKSFEERICKEVLSYINTTIQG